MTEEHEVGRYIGTLIGQLIAYKIYRWLGAPRWAALGFADLEGRLTHIAAQLKDLHDQTQR